MVGKPIAVADNGHALYVYVAAHCSGCARAVALARRVQALLPQWAVRVVDIDEALLLVDSAPLPRYVVGTPMYVADNQIVSWGNPAEEDLIRLLREMEIKGTNGAERDLPGI